MSKELPEVENIVAGPGSLLAESRISQGLSIEDVATRLNFKVSLVKNLEADIYDKDLPDTFNRGYLKNYAKLVNIPNTDVLGLYENLNVVQKSPSRMQSFSNGTTKEAQNSMLMWITYLILTIFIVFTVMWWLQDDDTTTGESSVSETSIEANKQANAASSEPEEHEKNEWDEEPEPLKKPDEGEASSATIVNASSTTILNAIPEENVAELTNVSSERIAATESLSDSAANISEVIELTKVVFTFSGDCWVNIQDALGERVAWGIKKTDYVMTIEAQAPLKITIGKPELVEIDFGGENVDMSVFPEGHIAKFTLPLSPQSS